jgi:hypothetical protein
MANGINEFFQRLTKGQRTQNILAALGLGIGAIAAAVALFQYVKAQPPPPPPPPPPSVLRLTITVDQDTVNKGTPITVRIKLSNSQQTDIANKPIYFKVFDSSGQDVTSVFTSTNTVTTDANGNASITLQTSNAPAGTYTIVVATSQEELTLT